MSPDNERIVLRESVVVRGISTNRNLSLMMIACEQCPPYGGMYSTASMFLHLITTAIQEKHNRRNKITSAGAEKDLTRIDVSIFIYNAQTLDYPTSDEEWDSFDGIILPGSFNSAYDSLEWIQYLKEQVILKRIHPYQRKTLGICFGHQIMAHAFYPDGLATPCKAGSQMGCKVMYGMSSSSNITTTSNKTTAWNLLVPDSDRTTACTCSKRTKRECHLYYTHGDMVAKLPPCAIPLACTSNVDIVAAAFFGSSEDAMQYQEKGIGTESKSVPSINPIKLPYAITLQAHPEFFDSDGLAKHFRLCIKSMMYPQKSVLSEQEQASCDSIFHGALIHKDEVWNDTMDLMIRVGAIFNWF
jgi:GMP synthase-like glutamine amidotransferase